MNDFDRPLGLDSTAGFDRAARGGGLKLSSGPVAGFGSAALILVVGAYAAVFGSPDGGRARSVGRIVTADAPAPAPPPPPAIPQGDVTSSIPPQAPGASALSDLERSSGVRVTRGGGADAPTAVVIRVDPAGRLPPAPDPRLVEKTRLGVLPRIGADGTRPAQAYARPFQPINGAPRIALMIDGLGLSSATTAEALEKLPPAVSFAFAPYGDDLAATAAKAREKGHETVLQLPMEPLDSAHNDPGPHTLQLAAAASETDADLQWLMSRFPGYFAVSPFLGGRFLQSVDALTPVMRDLAQRGVAVIDDGAAPRPTLEAVAKSVGAPFGRAVRLDATDAKSLDAAVTKLEAQAREKGFAIGAASALPQSVDRLARLAAALESRGFVLAPVSALLGRQGDQGGEARR